MDALTSELISEIKIRLSPEESVAFENNIENSQFRQAYLILEKMKKNGKLSEELEKNIEHFWWKYAN